ncbi:cytochrome c biogenesis protein CcsA [Rhodothermus profundi]|uniref:Heme exporter protein C n=1 Tax=Rhodothermus profundi TaxID=633813 RepID=A0A1M6RV37_9BACT|nr:cytochrome c biogenesis protein CcsA [Rhodothermus profundi]SHK36270.1 heme exporter protein C [Rhodothermus profundi]
MTEPTAPVNLRRYRRIRNAVVVWLTLVIVGAFLLRIPRIHILEHTARNLYFHVPMWFTLMAAALVSAYHSLRYLQSGDPIRDLRAREAARVGIAFGLLGLATGIVWARFTWYLGTSLWWNFDPKQSFVVIQLLIYGAYFVLRGAVEDPEKRGRVAAVYNLFACVTMPFLLYVLPRQMESLHPGAEGSPAFSDITHPIMRLVFYPAVIGFIGLFWVLYTQRVRLALLERRLEMLQATMLEAKS